MRFGKMMLLVGLLSLLLVAFGGFASAADNSVLKVDSARNFYAYLMKELSLPDSNDIVVEARMHTPAESAGSTWGPGIHLLWAAGGQASLLHTDKGNFRFGRAERSDVKADTGTWVGLKMEINATSVKFLVQSEGEDWTLIKELDRAVEGYVGPPMLLGVGKGALSGLSLSRSYKEGGAACTTYYDYVTIKVDGKLVLDEQFNDGDISDWEQYSDPQNPDPSFAVVGADQVQ